MQGPQQEAQTSKRHWDTQLSNVKPKQRGQPRQARAVLKPGQARGTCKSQTRPNKQGALVKPRLPRGIAGNPLPSQPSKCVASEETSLTRTIPKYNRFEGKCKYGKDCIFTHSCEICKVEGHWRSKCLHQPALGAGRMFQGMMEVVTLLKLERWQELLAGHPVQDFARTL